MVKIKPEEERALSAGWVDYGDGIQVTSSPGIIHKALEMIKRHHIFCTLVAQGYESGQVALVEFGQERISWDRPHDWPAGMAPQPLQVLFKDRGRLWNKFAVNFLEAVGDTLVTSRPQRYVVLQRRNNYRVPVPPGSNMSFHLGGQAFVFPLENISANGALLAVKELSADLPAVAVGGTIYDITLSFPLEESDAESNEAKVAISRGRVVRNYQQGKLCLVGTHFLIKPQEENALMNYVRRRERELLRRGMAD